MRSRQAGITFIGWVVLLIPLAMVVFAGIKLSTIYMNHYKVAKVMQQIADTSHEGSVITPQVVRGELERRFDIESIEDPTPDNISVEKDGDSWVMVADYERKTDLFGNLSLVVHFNKRVVLK